MILLVFLWIQLRAKRTLNECELKTRLVLRINVAHQK
jgi:hypothetical protein